MIYVSAVFFIAALASVFFQSKGTFGSDDVSWSVTGIFMFLALVTFIRGIFAARRMHSQSHHTLP